MPKQKDLKRLIRARMKKTNESYTTARLHILDKKPKEIPNGLVKAPKPDYAAITRMSDEALQKATGCNWERWVNVLDRAKAFEKSHREIAAYIAQKYKTLSWWTQMVTVGYERIRGLREVGQQRGGDYRMTRSKTIAVPLRKLYAAFSTPQARARWLGDVKLTVRTATPGKRMRIRWHDNTAVDIGFTARGEGKSQVALEHSKLATKLDAERLKAFWGERLEALAAVLKG
jgi:uncharacterized protein YndB with AHSA1/START domain